jgi:hypothetical protein
MTQRPWRSLSLSALKTGSAYVVVQLLVQGTNAVAGLAIVRSLSVAEYALYTLAGTAIGMVAQLTDLGTGTALIALGGRVTGDRQALGTLLNTAHRLRRQLLLASAILGLGPLAWLMTQGGASLIAGIILATLVLINVAAQLACSISLVALRLHQVLGRLQMIDVAIACTRLALVLAVAAAASSALGMISAGVLPWLLGMLLAGRATLDYVDNAAAPSQHDRRELLGLVVRQLPNAVFYALYGHVTVVLLTLLGQPGQVAEVGAVGRVATLLAVGTAIVVNVATPRFARTAGRGSVASLYCAVLGAHFAACAVLVLGVQLLPGPLLWLLGPQYAGAHAALGWVAFSSVVHAFVGTAWSLNASRGWLTGAWLTIPAIVAAQAALVPLLDLSTTRGAVLFGCLPMLAALFVLVPRAYIGIRRLPAEASA